MVADISVSYLCEGQEYGKVTSICLTSTLSLASRRINSQAHLAHRALTVKSVRVRCDWVQVYNT